MIRCATALILLLSTISSLRATTGQLDTFAPTPRFEHPTPKWEVRLAAVPWIVNDWGFAQTLAVADPANPNSGSDYILNNGSKVRLVASQWDGEFSTAYPGKRKFSVPLTSFEVARRLPSGIRVALGLFHAHEPDISNRRVNEYNDFLNANRFVRFGSSSYQSIGAYTGIQYTINRRKRFRIQIGVNVMAIADETIRMEFLRGGETAQTHEVWRTVSRDVRIHALPQLTFEYMLSNDWSISLGGGTSMGLGVNYRW